MKIVIRFMILTLGMLLTSCGDQAVNELRQVITLDNVTSGRPYSPAIKTGNMLFVSGQIAVDPSTGKLVEGGIEEQTRMALSNLKALVEKAGFKLTDVVKCDVLLDTISDYGPMNAVYSTFFPENPPARKAYSVESLPLGAMVEIDAIAVK